jgi:hypothetical protein
MSESVGNYDPILGIWWYSDESSDTISEWTFLRYFEEYYDNLHYMTLSEDMVWKVFERQYIEEYDEGEWLSTNPLYHRESYTEE